jgi:hypothetical protein
VSDCFDVDKAFVVVTVPASGEVTYFGGHLADRAEPRGGGARAEGGAAVPVAAKGSGAVDARQ